MDLFAVESLILAVLPGAKVWIEDTRDDAVHYDIHVTSDDFREMPHLERHRKIQKALQSLTHDKMPFFSIHTHTP